MRPDVRVFLIGVAAAGLQTVADAFLLPEQGTRWSDHLVPGLSTLALLAVAAAGYPRLRAGGRAALSLLLGALSLEGAVVAVVNGLAGDDWTALLLFPSGAALCASGALVLWRSRKPGRLRYLRRAGLAAAAVLGVFWLVLPVVAALYATHRPRFALPPADLGASYERVRVPTADGLELGAWYVPSRNGAAVISFPTRRGKHAQARMLVRRGYGVLLLDMRGYEESDGTPNAFGWGAARDLDAAVEWLRRRPDVRDGRVGGIGFSVGGEMLLEAAAGNPGLRAVVSEGAGERSVRETLIRGRKGALEVPAMAIQTAAIALLTGTAPPPALDDLVARIRRPLLLIYAGRGQGGEDLNEDYFRAAHGPKELWRIAEAGHTGGYEADPAEYERRVVGFFDRHLLERL